MIEGILLKPLKPIPDERGHIMEIFRRDDSMFKKFGQVYVTSVYPDVVKAWHYHKIQTDNFAVVRGMIKLVIYDGREGSHTKGEVNEFYLGERNPMLVSIPPMIYHGFMGVSLDEAYIINIPTEPYNPSQPDEYRLPAHDPSIPYDWTRKDR